MKMHDYNTDKDRVILLIHPMMSDGAGLKLCITDHMGSDFRYLLPDLAAHGDAGGDTYHSAKEEASQIHDYLIEHGITHLVMGYCASLGACTLFELLEYKDIEFDHLFFEGASLYENTRLLFFLSRKMYLGRHSQALKNPEKAVGIMRRLYGESAAEAMAKRFIAMNEESIINICRDCSFVHLTRLDSEMQRNTIFAYGEKEFDLKNSRKVCTVRYPEAQLKVWRGLNHCQRISGDSEAYAEMLREIIEPLHEAMLS